MDIIYLPGNSLTNKSWIEKVKSHFDSFSTGEILAYDHWQTDQKWINLTQESKKLTQLIADKKDYFVFAKSIGSILALKNIFADTLHPAKIVICGFPYQAGKREFSDLDQCLKTLPIPTMFIQNESDPVCSFDDLSKILETNSPRDYHLIKNPATTTHDYEDYDALAKLVKIYFGDEDKQVHLQKIYQALDIVAKKLNSLNISWLLGASGALMVHGVKITPWDLDILTDPNNIEMLKNEFKQYFVSQDEDGLLLKIGDIEVEIIKLVDLGHPTTTQFQDNLIPVNTLENELYYYERRPGKENTIRLIKEKLLAKAETSIELGTKSSSPRLVILMGLPGSGKSYVSSYIHKKYGFSVISGENVTFALYGTKKCSASDYAHAYKILRQLAVKLLTDGYSVVIDGTNLKSAFRQQIYDEVKCSSTLLLYLKVDDKTALTRISNRGVDYDNQKDIKSSIDEPTFTKFKNQLEEPLSSEVATTLISDENILTQIDQLLHK